MDRALRVLLLMSIGSTRCHVLRKFMTAGGPILTNAVAILMCETYAQPIFKINPLGWM